MTTPTPSPAMAILAPAALPGMARSIGMDQAQRLDMAQRFPAAAFAAECGQGTARPLSHTAWLHGLAPDGRPAPELVEAALAAQLDGPWAGIEAQKPVRRAVLTLLAARAAEYDSSSWLSEMNQWAIEDAHADAHPDGVSFQSGSPLRWTEWDPGERLIPLRLQEAAAPVLKAVADRHGWTATVALEIIALAKSSGGVLPNAHFLWLSRYDPLLWRLLSGYGSAAPAVEILGAVAHHAAEKALGQPLPEVLLDDEAAFVLAQPPLASGLPAAAGADATP